jgi:hypothetical protein
VMNWLATVGVVACGVACGVAVVWFILRSI